MKISTAILFSLHSQCIVGLPIMVQRGTLLHCWGKEKVIDQLFIDEPRANSAICDIQDFMRISIIDMIIARYDRR